MKAVPLPYIYALTLTALLGLAIPASGNSPESFQTKAESIRQELRVPDLTDLWVEYKEVLASSASLTEGELDAILARFAASARVWVESEVLPSWAQAVQDGHGNAADQALITARRVGRALATRNLDQLTQDSIERIDHALQTMDDDQVAKLVEGHLSYSEALGHSSNGDMEAAQRALEAAREALASADSPFALWADYQVALAQFHGDVSASEVAMSKLLEQVGSEPYWPLRGWCHWLRGLARFKQGFYSLALEDYQQTYELLLQANDSNATAALGLQGDVYQALGLTGMAWELRLQAVDGLASAGNRPQLHNYLHEAVLVLLETNQIGEAAAWATELVANAEALGWPNQLAVATLMQGEILTALGEHEEARAVLQESQDRIRALPQEDLRAQLEVDASLAFSKLQAERDPDAAVDELSGALEVREEAGHTWQRPRILRDRARAYGNLGDTRQQRKDLETALKEVDRRRKEPGEERLRISYWETVQDLVDDMVRFQALTAQDPQEALLYAEQARGRALLDRLRAGWSEGDADGELQALEQGFPEVEKIREIQRLLPKGALLVETAVLDENLILWLLDRKNLEMRILHVEAKDLIERVEGLRSQMNQRAEEETIQEAAGDMFELLFGSVTDRLRKAEHLVIVPDRTLHRLPWAVLFDREEKKYLVEKHALTVLPSASILTLGRDREPFGTLEEGPVLVVGDPAFNRDVLDLERLPGAAEEARGVAGLYGRSTHLSDVQATRSQLLEALGQTRVLHVAGHVQVNERDPLQSSIPLTPETEDDLGLLHAREIYDLPLSNVELVVLSACRSVDGFPSGAREGVAGLARAFLAAGAGAVVASLWDVYDKPSRKLMKTFHGHFREGVPPAEALRRAQISLLESADPQLRNPASWAGFEALGWAF